MQSRRVPRVLIIPGLNGDPGMLMRAGPVLFPSWRPVAFNHHRDAAEGGVERTQGCSFGFHAAYRVS